MAHSGIQIERAKSRSLGATFRVAEERTDILIRSTYLQGKVRDSTKPRFPTFRA